MDCSTCRSLFSVSFDERLFGERVQEFSRHLKACTPCTSEFELYRRVFSTIRELPDGAAPPFNMPNEVPGSLAPASRFQPRPRFARAAASVLLLLGLVGTHVLVFQWSRERVSGAVAVSPPSNLPIAQANLPGLLPSSLRDHVDATDLFIRTAAQVSRLPEDAASRNFAEADWVASDLARRTAELRQNAFAVPERAQVERYLLASDDFVARTRRLMEEPPKSSLARAILDAAAQSGVVREMYGIMPVVAPLQFGTSFSGTLAPSPAVARLKPDGRLILEAKRARLAGKIPLSIEGFQRFDRDYGKSPLNPLAAFLHAEALVMARRYGAAQETWSRGCNVVVSGSANAPQVLVFRELELCRPPVFIDRAYFPNGGMSLRLFHGPPPPMKTTMPIQPLVEDGVVPEVEPKR